MVSVFVWAYVHASRWRKAFHSVRAIARMRRLASRDNEEIITENGAGIAPSVSAVLSTDDDSSSAPPLNDAISVPAGAVTDSGVSITTASQKDAGQVPAVGMEHTPSIAVAEASSSVITSTSTVVASKEEEQQQRPMQEAKTDNSNDSGIILHAGGFNHSTHQG